ncbi:MAG: AMP-binding protein [Actinobacteria bacterium]|nr:AMP-binding protein [Actinomycetota bacterium]
MPTPEIIDNANVTRFMRAHGIDGWRELVRRSQDDIAWFWDAVIKDLGLVFTKPYHAVVDSPKGIAWSVWFPGGETNLTDNCVDRRAEGERAGDPAVLWEGEDGETRRLSFAELREDVDRFANALRTLGVASGDAVGLFLPMIPENVVAFYACAKIGAIVLPIFSGFSAPAVAARLQDAGAKVLITADGFWRRGSKVRMKEVADEAAAASPSVKSVVVVRRLGDEVPWSDRDVDYRAITAMEKPAAESVPLAAEHPLMIAYTSGTTGRPKGSVHVHGGFLVKIAEEAAYQTDVKAGDILFWFTDMGWIMGPWEVVGAHANGAAVFLYEGAPDFPAPDRIWSMVERHKITILGLSPTLVRALIPHGDEHVTKHDRSSLRVLGSTGEPWNPDPWLWFLNVVGEGRCPIINFSGGTEVGACFLSPMVVTPLRPCTLGGPSLGMAIDVYDPDGKPLGPGHVGELVCTKPWPGMTRGIWGDPDRFIATYWSRWPDVWVHGDWASTDADGFWYLHGRSDDTLKIAGKRLGPAEVESLLASHSAVAESAAVGVPDEVKGEKVWCFVVLKPGVEATDALRAELRAVVEAGLGKSFRPDAVRFVSALPKTRSAKILRRAVRAAALGEDPGDLSSLENPAALDEVAKSV